MMGEREKERKKKCCMVEMKLERREGCAFNGEVGGGGGCMAQLQIWEGEAARNGNR